MTRQVTDQLYIDLGYYNPEEYYTYEASAESALASEFSVTATISHIEGVDIVANSFATVDVSGDKIRTVAAALTSEFTVTASSSGFEEATAALSSASSIEITVTKISDATVSLTSEFTQTTQAERFIQIDTALTSAVTQVSNIEVTRGFGVGLSSDADCACVNYRVREEACDAGALFNVAIAATATINSFAILDSVSTVTADVDRIVGDSSATLSSATTVSASVNKIKSVSAGINSTATLYANRYFGTGRPRNLPTGTYTTTAKFGTYSLIDANNSNSITTLGTTRPRSSDDWVLEGWYYAIATTSGTRVWTINLEWAGIIITGTNSSSTKAVTFRTVDNTETTTNHYNQNRTFTLNTWHHIAAVKTGSTLSFYIGGTRIVSVTAPASYRNDTFNLINIGTTAAGHIDEVSLRIGDTYGYSASSTTITPPSAARTNDPDSTRFLYHFENNNNDDITVPIQSAQASLTASVSITALPDPNIKLMAAELVSQGFVVAAVARKVDEFADLSGTSTLSCNAGRLIDSDSSMSANTSQTTNISIIKQFASSITGAFNASITVTEFEGVGQIPMTASFAVSALANQRHSGRSTITAISTVTPNVSAFSRYWFNVLESQPDDVSRGYGLDSDSQGNIYSVGYYGTDAPEYDYDLIALKYSKLGVVDWQTKIQTPTALGITNSENVLDSDGNIYVTGSIEESYPTYTYQDLFLLKLNSSGVLQWSRFLRAGNSTNQYGYKVDIDSSNNVYVAGLGRIFVSGQPDTQVGLLAKYTSSGTLTWQKNISGIYGIYGIAVKGSNFYVTGETAGSSSRKVFVAKLTLDGDIVWQKSISDINIDSEWGTDISVDNQGNVFVSGYDTGLEKTLFLKFNNSGTIQFQKLISKTGVAQLVDPSMTVDLSDNVLLSLPNSGTGYTSIATFDNSGNLTRARFINVSSEDISTDRYNDIILTGSSNSELITVKLPSDGSRTEFITEFDYLIENNLVIETSSYTVADASSTVSSASWTTTPYTLTQVTNTDDSSLYVINQLISGSAVLTSQFSQSTTVGKIRQFSSGLSCTFTQASIASKIVRAQAAFSTNVTLVGNVRRTRTTASSLSSVATQSTVNQRLRFAQSQITVTSTLTASGDRTRLLTSAITSNAEITTDNQRVRYFDTAFDSIATQLTAAGYNATGTVLLESRFESSVQAQKTTDITKTLNAVTDINIVNDRFREVTSNQTVVSTWSCDALNIRPAGSDMAVTTSMSINTDNSRIVGVTSNNNSEFTQSTVNKILRLAVAALSANTTISILAFKVKQFNIAVTSRASIQTLTGIRADARANLPSIATQLSVGDVIQIDPFYQIKVEPETRQGTVLPENRVIQVEQETRLNMIL